MTEPIRLPVVERVATDDGDQVIPPMDGLAPYAEQLAWHAAVIALDSGQPVKLWTDNRGRLYNIALPAPDGSHGSSGPMRFDAAWSYLNGVRGGIAAQKKRSAS